MTEPKNKLSRSDKTSFLALLLSIAALAIGIIEARIMSKQQDTMVQQQKAAVWPYVELRSGIQVTDSLLFESEAENKGVGPAIIKEMSVEFNDQTYKDIKAFSSALDELIGKGQYSITRFGISQTTKSVYKPGESRTLLEIAIHNEEAFTEKVGYFNVNLVYCSIFDECWRENGEELSTD